MTTLSEDIDYLAVETQSESNDGRASAATWEHEDLAQARRSDLTLLQYILYKLNRD